MATIDKLAWLHVKDRKVLFARSQGKDIFYTAGGKREPGESDEQALQREIKEELNIELIPESIKYLATFTGQADSRPAGVMVQIKCFTSDYKGDLKPTSEIEELAWFTSVDKSRTTQPGQMALQWLKEHNYID